VNKELGRIADQKARTKEEAMAAILVVDDDADTCRNMADLLGDRGYQVDAAENGDIALEKARHQRYDMGLLDLRMPGMDGLTLCRRLKQVWPSMVTLIVTGCPRDGLDQEAVAAGARHVVSKPVDMARLFTLVEQTIAASAD
jgi:two-component system response regulator AtoC